MNVGELERRRRSGLGLTRGVNGEGRARLSSLFVYRRWNCTGLSLRSVSMRFEYTGNDRFTQKRLHSAVALCTGAPMKKLYGITIERVRRCNVFYYHFFLTLLATEL